MTADLIGSLSGRLIVSCQAYPGEPMRHPETMAKVAAAVEDGGAAAVRVQGLEDIVAVRRRVRVTVVGLWKDGSEGVFITPTLEHVRAVAGAGAQVVAFDATRRPRADGSTVADSVRLCHDLGVLAMADCDDVASAVAAAEAGADLVGTTLAGYTPARAKGAGPDLELVATLAQEIAGTPLVAEGRVHTPAQAAAALAAGAHSVVVGTAITHPTSIARWFADALDGA